MYKKVRDERTHPDYSRPPPGYLPTGQRLGQPESLQPNSQSELAPSQQPAAYPTLMGSTEHHYEHHQADVSCIFYGYTSCG